MQYLTDYIGRYMWNCNSAQLYSIIFNSIQFHSILFNSISFNHIQLLIIKRFSNISGTLERALFRLRYISMTILKTRKKCQYINKVFRRPRCIIMWHKCVQKVLRIWSNIFAVVYVVERCPALPAGSIPAAETVVFNLLITFKSVLVYTLHSLENQYSIFEFRFFRAVMLVLMFFTYFAVARPNHHFSTSNGPETISSENRLLCDLCAVERRLVETRTVAYAFDE